MRVKRNAISKILLARLSLYSRKHESTRLFLLDSISSRSGDVFPQGILPGGFLAIAVIFYLPGSNTHNQETFMPVLWGPKVHCFAMVRKCNSSTLSSEEKQAPVAGFISDSLTVQERMLKFHFVRQAKKDSLVSQKTSLYCSLLSKMEKCFSARKEQSVHTCPLLAVMNYFLELYNSGIQARAIRVHLIAMLSFHKCTTNNNNTQPSLYFFFFFEDGKNSNLQDSYKLTPGGT